MRCNILCLNQLGADLQSLTPLLKQEGFNASIAFEPLDKCIHAIQKGEPFDVIFVLSSTDEALLSAKAIRKESNLRETPIYFVVDEAQEALVNSIKDIGIEFISVGLDSMQNIAMMIKLILNSCRANCELRSMGEYIREASIVIEEDEEDRLRISDVNQTFLTLEGIKREDIIDKELAQTEFVFDISMLHEDVQEVFDTGSALHLPSFFYIKEDKREWFDIYIYKSSLHQVSIIAAPLSEIKRAHDKAEESRRYLQTILNAQKHIIYITDGKNLINTNSAFLEFFGFDTMYDYLQKYQTVCDLFEPSDEPNYIDKNNPAWMEDVLRSKESIHKIRVKNNGVVSIFVPSIEVINIDGKKQYVVILTDITELESEKEKLRVIAMTDALTGAANRFKFNTIIEDQIATAKRYKSELSLILFDIDKFKSINDEYTHAVGDKILKTIARLVMDDIRESDIFVRWGGEEFIIMLNNTSKENAYVAAEKIRKRFENYDFGEVKQVTSSFGVSALASDDTISTLVNRVDEAMYQAKKAGGNCTKML